MRNPGMESLQSKHTIDSLLMLLNGRAVSYELYLSSAVGLNVEVREGAVEALKVKSSKGVGLRVITDKRPGFAFTSAVDEQGLKELVERAISAAAGASADEYAALPVPAATALDAESLDILDNAFGDAPEEEKIAFAERIEEAAMSRDSRIKRVRKASYGETMSYARVVNSNGVDLENTATYYTGSVTAVAEEAGASETGWDMDTSHKRSSIDAGRIGARAAGFALRMLGARKLQSIKCPAVFENTVVCEFLETLAPSFSADNVSKGKSMLAGMIGKKAVSSCLTIYDDGLLKGGWAASPFDGEGVPRRKTALVQDGVCMGWLFDTYWAKRQRRESTGSASRSGYKGTPGIGITNLYIEKGERGIERLFSEMGRGLYITELLGAHTVNSVTGEFSLGAAGLWIERGKPAYPVRGMAIAGNLLGLFSRVSAVGSDMRFIGSIGAPSLLVDEIEASGS